MAINLEKKAASANPASFILGIIVLAGFLAMGIGLSKVQGYLDLPSFAIVFGFVLAFLLITSGLWNLLRAICAAFVGKITSIEDAEAAIVSCSVAIWAALIGGIVGALIGSINILTRPTIDVPPSTTDLTMGFAVAFLTILYGIIFAGIFLAIRARIIQALYHHEEQEIEEELVG